MGESLGGRTLIPLVVGVLTTIVSNTIWQFLRDEGVSIQDILIVTAISIGAVILLLVSIGRVRSVCAGFHARAAANRSDGELLRKYLLDFQAAQGQLRVLTEGIRGNQPGSVTLNILDRLKVPYPSKSDFSESHDDMRVWNPLSSDSPESQNYVRAWHDFITQLPPLAEKGDIKGARRLWPDMRDPPSRLKRIWRRVGS